MICKHDPKTDFITGIKSFDKKTGFGDSILQGNCTTDGLCSSFIRPYSEVECNGFTRKPGELRQFDLDQFRNYRIPFEVQLCLDRHKNEKLVLYVIRTYRTKNGSPTIHGWIITTSYETEYELVMQFNGKGRSGRIITDACVIQLTGSRSPYHAGSTWSADEENKVRERFGHDTEQLAVALDRFYQAHPEKKPCSTPTNESSTTAEPSPAARSAPLADA